MLYQRKQRSLFIVSIGTSDIKANCPEKWQSFGGSLELTEGWPKNILKAIKWSKRKGTTGKIKTSEQFIREEMLTFQKYISNVIEVDDIAIGLAVNLDQTPLSYVSPGKYTFNPSGAKTVPIKGIDDKSQITETFAVTMTGKSLSVQLIYEGKPHICLPNFEFPKCFNVTYSANHW